MNFLNPGNNIQKISNSKMPENRTEPSDIPDDLGDKNSKGMSAQAPPLKGKNIS